MMHWQQLEQLNSDRHQRLLSEADTARLRKRQRQSKPPALERQRFLCWLGHCLVIVGYHFQTHRRSRFAAPVADGPSSGCSENATLLSLIGQDGNSVAHTTLSVGTQR